MNNPMAGTDTSGYECEADGGAVCDVSEDWVGEGDRRSVNQMSSNTNAAKVWNVSMGSGAVFQFMKGANGAVLTGFKPAEASSASELHNPRKES